MKGSRMTTQDEITLNGMRHILIFPDDVNLMGKNIIL